MARNGGASAREQARKLQQEQERKQKMQSLLLRLGVVAVALAVVIGLTFWVLTREGGGSYTEGPAPAAATEQGGFVLTSSSELAEGADLGTIDSDELDDVAIGEGAEGMPTGVQPREEGEIPHVIIYTDAGCPACGTFESAYHGLLMQWLDAGAITLEYRSVNYQPGQSARAANAFACMAEESPENYFSYLGAITSERAQGADYSNDELLARAQNDYGVDLSDCINDGTYRAFVNYTTTLASASGANATPLIWVDDQLADPYMETGDLIMAAVQEYQEETGEDLLGIDIDEEDLEDIDEEEAPEQSEADNGEEDDAADEDE
ncbi:thioredoxin domain-containing protein [Nesterenkonia ebinurensis]|uniref:thioredoxin domain-containing protein n=1 Tax=Nesterenkonia ebinurensis TaxID=2608252 RepID=UPI00123DE2C1|nr:thioredoxin domain-containing protein [Nesterenkonia ebinurensis]